MKNIAVASENKMILNTEFTSPKSAKSAHKNSLWWDALRRMKKDKIGMISFWIILGYILMAILAKTGIIFPDVGLSDTANQYLSFSWQHPFGTDVLGRDILARAVHGTATALAVGLIASGIALVIGTSLGAIAGYFGGRTDAMIVWLYTTIDSIPYILLIPALTFVLGRGLINVFIAVGMTSWVTLCRLIRAEVLKHKGRD